MGPYTVIRANALAGTLLPRSAAVVHPISGTGRKSDQDERLGYLVVRADCLLVGLSGSPVACVYFRANTDG